MRIRKLSSLTRSTWRKLRGEAWDLGKQLGASIPSWNLSSLGFELERKSHSPDTMLASMSVSCEDYIGLQATISMYFSPTGSLTPRVYCCSCRSRESWIR